MLEIMKYEDTAANLCPLETKLPSGLICIMVVMKEIRIYDCFMTAMD